VPAGEFITAMGGWNLAQFAEKRLPTLAELDAAAPNHPVIVYQGFTGPAATNTKGMVFFHSEERCGESDPARLPPMPRPWQRSMRCAPSRPSKTRNAGRWTRWLTRPASASPPNVDMGAFVIPGLPDIQDSFVFNGLASQDPFHMYDAFAELSPRGKILDTAAHFLSHDGHSTQCAAAEFSVC